jgi:hypothetical protein
MAHQFLYCHVCNHCCGEVFTLPLPSSSHIFWLHYSGLQQLCQNICMKLLLIACIVDTGQSTRGFCIVHKFKYFVSVSYPESKFWWAIENKTVYFQTIYIAIWCTYRTLLFDIVSTIVEALVIARHQLLYSCMVEWCRLWCKPRVKGFFDLVVGPPATKESFQVQEHMKITWR